MKLLIFFTQTQGIFSFWNDSPILRMPFSACFFFDHNRGAET
jgi:hypothetical protein